MVRKVIVEEPAVKRTRRTKAEVAASKEVVITHEPKRRVKKVAVVVEEEAPKRRSKKVVEEEPTPTKRRSKKVVEEEAEEEQPTTARRKKPKTLDVEMAKAFNPLSSIDDALDDIERGYGLTGGSLGMSGERQHTGLLELDLILGKGIQPGWYTFFGPEQSCKSTGAATWMVAGLMSEIPVIQYWDYEGSSSPEYIENIMEVNGITMPIEQVFGIRDPKTQKWAIPPRVRYYSEGVGEKFFDALAKLERLLPDKLEMNDEWYYVYEGTKENRKIVGERFDKNYFRKTGKYRVEAPDGNLQALLILDSYPAMLPEKQDVDDPGSSMAVQARMFSDQMKRVKGKMKAKRIAVVGVNQLRKAPMVMFGSPEYEPGGEALKFFSDVRLRMQPRVMNAAPGISGKGMILEEKSINGGKDTYRFIHVRAHKNKLSVPNLEGWLRLWITDDAGEARGFDPVWDTWMYLTKTSQCTGKMNAFKITIKGKESKKTLTWLDFKLMVLGTRKDMRGVCEKAGIKAFDIREFCTKQLHERNGLELYFENIHSKGAEEEDDDEAGSTPKGEDED